jgi:DNA excision repair protein ERCC-2
MSRPPAAFCFVNAIAFLPAHDSTMHFVYLPACLPQFLGVGLSSRRNLCVHDAVAQFEQKDKVDSMCRALTTSWVRQQHRDEQKSADELCPYFEGFDKNGADASLTGIYDLHDLKALGRRETWCPYFLARHLINLANVVIFNYQYMIDPKIASLVSSQVW